MLRTIVSDTSCFIILSTIGELDVLQRTFGDFITAIDVVLEFGEDLHLLFIAILRAF